MSAGPENRFRATFVERFLAGAKDGSRLAWKLHGNVYARGRPDQFFTDRERGPAAIEFKAVRGRDVARDAFTALQIEALSAAEAAGMAAAGIVLIEVGGGDRRAARLNVWAISRLRASDRGGRLESATLRNLSGVGALASGILVVQWHARTSDSDLLQLIYGSAS